MKLPFRQIGFLFLLGASVRLLPAQNRILRPVDPSRLTVLRRHVPEQAQAQYDLGPADADTMLRYVTLRLKPAAGLEQFLAEQRMPSSPNYHRWLTPDQFGERFGVTEDDVAKLVAWLRSEGLQIHDVAKGRHWITFSGSVAQITRAFHTEIHRYRVSGELHLANTSDPSIPDALEDVVSGIEGLDDFGLKPLFQLEQPGIVPQFTSGAARYVAPDDFATIYNVMPLYAAGIDGSGQKVAVIGRSAINLADIRQFRQNFQLAPNDPQLLLVGPDPGITSSIVESNLDIQWVGAVARQATVVYVYSNSVTTAVEYAVDQNVAPVITFSYGGCEAYSPVGLRAVAQQANAQGITWVAASGDWGAATCDLSSPIPQASKGPSASFPASIPEITAVGGTEFNDGTGEQFWAPANTPSGSSALSYVPERPWNTSALRNDLTAGGGGPSIFFGKPSWQTGPGVPNDNARDTPDVALAASPLHYAYIMFSGGSLIHVGGTSVSAPAFAGILALLNQQLASSGSQAGLGNINPMLYRLAQSTTDIFHDITGGDNRVPCAQGSPACTAAGMGYAATRGYDMASGLGSVDAYHLAMEWKSGTASSTALSATPSAVSLGDTVTLTATVTGNARVPTGSVSFLADTLGVGTAALNTSGVATLTVPAARAAAGDGTLTAVYSGDAVFDSSSATANLALNVPASGSYVVPFVTPNPVTQAGPYWPYTVGLVEKAGVPTTLTSFTIDGVRQNLGFWSSTTIPAKGTVSADLSGSGLAVPLNRVFVFSGRDANGQTWTQQITVPFLAAPGPVLAPSVTLSIAPSTIRQNPQADATCQWAQQIFIQETGGFLIQLSSLRAGSTDFTSQLQQIFGTTRLAPYGMLQGTLCWDATSVMGPKQLQFVGISELGSAVSATASATLTSAAAAPPSFSVSPSAVQILIDASSHAGPATLTPTFNPGVSDWTARVLPANRTSDWLKISGSSPGPVTLLASSNGLANGVYRATVSIEAPDAVPPVILVPVTMVVGASSNLSISGITNAATGTAGFAPGMPIVVSGQGLTSSTFQATTAPLPLTVSDVSATVNGVSAPLLILANGQLVVQIPYETGAGSAVLAVNNNGQVASYSFPVAIAAPGIYRFFIDNNTGARNSGRPGDILTMFATGAGDLAPSLATGTTPSPLTAIRSLPRPRLPVTVTVGGKPADILFAGNASGLVGAIQINFTLPLDLAPGPQPVVVAIGDAVSAPVNLPILSQAAQ